MAAAPAAAAAVAAAAACSRRNAASEPPRRPYRLPASRTAAFRDRPTVTRSNTFARATSAVRAESRVEAAPDNGAGISGRVVVIDNYDSFTYNLCQYLGDLGCDYIVHRNDEITVEQLTDLRPRGILISPGPGSPEDSGISLDTVLKLGPIVPVFGVCMGLQCMGQAFGGNIVRAPNGVMHGKTSKVYHNQHGADDGLLSGLPNPFIACRYHSLVVDRESFPDNELEITAWTEDNLIMGIRHRKHRYLESCYFLSDPDDPAQGVQFHPESIITQNGKKIVENFVHSLQRFEQELREEGSMATQLPA
eukprot:SM000001S04712  [mRNA]  locus=s1:1798407:1800582:+ [translate_table: standard]